VEILHKWDLITLFIVLAAFVAYKIIRSIYKTLSDVSKHNKMVRAFKEKHCSGPHEYTNIYLPQVNKECKVCKECGYISDLNSYVDTEGVRRVVALREEEEKYNEWKEEQKVAMSLKFNIGYDVASEIAEKALGFKRDYHLFKISQKVDELEGLSKKVGKEMYKQ